MAGITPQLVLRENLGNEFCFFVCLIVFYTIIVDQNNIDFFSSLGVEPVFHIGSAESDDYQPSVEVRFITLERKTVFDKIQSRSGGVAKQRVWDGSVHMEASSPVRQILGIKVWVTREKEAAELHKDRNGAVQLQVSYGQQNIDKVSFLLITSLFAEAG